MISGRWVGALLTLVATRGVVAQSPAELELPDVVVEGEDRPDGAAAPRDPAATAAPAVERTGPRTKASGEGSPVAAPLDISVAAIRPSPLAISARVSAGRYGTLDAAARVRGRTDLGDTELEVGASRSGGHVDGAGSSGFRLLARTAQGAGSHLGVHALALDRELWGVLDGSPVQRRVAVGATGGFVRATRPLIGRPTTARFLADVGFAAHEVAGHGISGADVDASAEISTDLGGGLAALRGSAQLEPDAWLGRGGVRWSRSAGGRLGFWLALEALAGRVDGASELEPAPSAAILLSRSAGTLSLAASMDARLDGVDSLLEDPPPAVGDPAPLLVVERPRVRVELDTGGGARVAVQWARRRRDVLWSAVTDSTCVSGYVPSGLWSRVATSSDVLGVELAWTRGPWELSAEAERRVGTHGGALPFVPERRGSASMGLDTKIALFGARLRGASRVTTDGACDGDLDPWLVADVSAARSVGGGFTAELSLRNLLNESYEEWSGYPEAGTWVGLSLSRDWKREPGAAGSGPALE